MGFYFRKTAKVGPFRITASKSGLSTSFGGKGARVTSGPRGTYITVGSHGFYYRTRLSGPPVRRQLQTPGSPSPAATNQTADLPEIDLALFAEATGDSVLREINEHAHRLNPALFGLIGCGFLFFFALGNPLLFIGVFLLAIGTLALHIRHRRMATSRLFYELDEKAQTQFALIGNAVNAFLSAQYRWRVYNERAVANRKYHAGASSLLSRVAVGSGKPVPHIKSNFAIPSIDSHNSTLYFFPDRILVWQNKIYGAFPYEALEVVAGSTRFVETGFVPADTQVVDWTWQYVNKSGGPDRRFSDNPRIPVALYGTLTVRAAGMDLAFETSSMAAAAQCAALFTQAKHFRQQARIPGAMKAPGKDSDNLFQVFGLTSSAKKEEVQQAYHRLIAMYHPDKVAHLGPEFRALAEERTKDINMAYQDFQKVLDKNMV